MIKYGTMLDVFGFTEQLNLTKWESQNHDPGWREIGQECPQEKISCSGLIFPF